jgi:hypothetical protein
VTTVATSVNIIRSTIITGRARIAAGAFVGHARHVHHKHLPQQPVAGTVTS